jgi:PAS domain S-box-containing protein
MKSKSELALPRDTFLLDLVQVAVVSLDNQGRVSLVNRKGCDLLGYDADEILGRNWFESFLPESIRDETAEVFRRLMNDEAGGVEYFENPVLTRAGEERLIAWHNAILRDRAGKPTGTLSSGEDITDRKAAEEELHQSNRELLDIKTALDQAAIVAATDRRGVIDYVNDKFCEISGYSARELLGQDHRLINSGYHPKSFMRELWRTIQSGRIWRGEIRNRAKDGTHYWVDTTIVPFMDESGTPYRYMAIRSDITDRKLAEEELRKSEALARVGHMAAIVAHEVKNPLAGIGGAVQIIGERLPESSPDREVIGSILERIDALNRKVEDLLAFSRPKPPHFEDLPLHLLLRETVGFLASDPRMDSVRVELEPVELMLSGDTDLLREVFVNLLLNSAQAMGGEGGRILVSMNLDGDACRVEVADDGLGIPGEARERVFEPFYSTRHNGTGLGLAIAKRVVEDHGGEISLQCPRDGGTTVVVRLPLERPENGTSGLSPASRRASS